MLKRKSKNIISQLRTRQELFKNRQTIKIIDIYKLFYEFKDVNDNNPNIGFECIFKDFFSIHIK